LVESHLIGASAYKHVRQGGEHQVVVAHGSAVMISIQIRDYLLCKPCDDYLSERGEKWVFEHMYRADGRFWLRDNVATIPPALAGTGLQLHSVANCPQVIPEKMIYFAASVLWRHAVHEWPNQDLRKIKLGKYQEVLRQYLLGLQPLPQEIAVWVSLIFTGDASRAIFFPTQQRQSGYHQYRFMIPGLIFDVFVGNQIPQINRNLSLSGPGQYVIVGSHVEDVLVRWAGPLVAEAVPKGKLAQGLLPNVS
jgi:hypothetical protein